VKQLEQMHSALAELDSEEREEFRRFAAELAARNADAADRLSELATHLLD
jgi:hypothetical protein